MKNKLFVIAALFSMSNFVLAMDNYMSTLKKALNEDLIHEFCKLLLNRTHDTSTIKSLIQQGADINLVTDGVRITEGNIQFRLYNLPLLEICLSHPDILMHAIQHNADIEMPNRNGRTLLLRSLSLKRSKAFKILLDHGANCNVLEEDGTPLFEECRNKLDTSYFNYLCAFCIPFRFEKYISPSLRRDPEKALEIVTTKQALKEKITRLGDVSFFHA